MERRRLLKRENKSHLLGGINKFCGAQLVIPATITLETQLKVEPTLSRDQKNMEKYFQSRAERRKNWKKRRRCETIKETKSSFAFISHPKKKRKKEATKDQYRGAVFWLEKLLSKCHNGAADNFSLAVAVSHRF
jgi:hypothetical protein